MVLSALTGFCITMSFPNTWLLRRRARAVPAVESLKTKNILEHLNIGTENAAHFKPQGKLILYYRAGSPLYYKQWF